MLVDLWWFTNSKEKEPFLTLHKQHSLAYVPLVICLLGHECLPDHDDDLLRRLDAFKPQVCVPFSHYFTLLMVNIDYLQPLRLRRLIPTMTAHMRGRGGHGLEPHRFFFPYSLFIVILIIIYSMVYHTTTTS